MTCILRKRAVFKWLSKIIVIGLKDSRQVFNQWESKPKPIAPFTRDFSRASSELQVIARNCDWFIALPAPVVIGRSNYFGFGFSTVIWNRSINIKLLLLMNLSMNMIGCGVLRQHWRTGTRWDDNKVDCADVAMVATASMLRIPNTLDRKLYKNAMQPPMFNSNNT